MYMYLVILTSLSKVSPEQLSKVAAKLNFSQDILLKAVVSKFKGLCSMMYFYNDPSRKRCSKL
jgi:hypothetical protein